MAVSVDKKVVDGMREYLVSRGKRKLVEAFDKEFGTAGNKTAAKLGKAALQIMEHFSSGQGSQFLAIWEKSIPDNILGRDRTCRKLESSCQIYFAVYHLRRGSGQQSSECRAAMEVFQHFLQNRGKQMGEFDEFAPFFALPYIPDAKQHKPFEHVFTDGWVDDLKTRLEAFLGSVLKEQYEPLLVKLVKSMDESGQVPDVKEVKTLQEQATLSEDRARQYLHQYYDAVNDFQWVLQVASDLAQALIEAVNGRKVTVEEVSELCARIVGRDKQNEGSSTSRPTTAIDVLQQSMKDMSIGTNKQSGNVFPSLDYEEIKKKLIKVEPLEAALIFQALRMRLTRVPHGEQRDHIILAYTRADIFGCTTPGPYQNWVRKALKSPKPELQESAARLLNALASLKGGRAYLCQQGNLVPFLRSVLDGFQSDDVAMRSFLAALQKLSLVRSQQSVMVKNGVIEWLLTVLGDAESQSPHTLHYASALLMNLCLHTCGKVHCVKNAGLVLKVLSELLEGDDLEARSYINGTLYSLFSVAQMREQAKGMGLDVVLVGLKDASPPNMASQLTYVLKQLNSDTNVDLDEDESDNEEEEDEDVPEVLDDVDSGDTLAPSGSQLAGEDLLRRDFLNILPSSIRLGGNSGASRPGTTSRHTTLTAEMSDSARPLDRPVTPRHPHLLAEMRGNESPPPTARPGTGGQKSSRTKAQASVQNKQQQPRQQTSSATTQANKAEKVASSRPGSTAGPSTSRQSASSRQQGSGSSQSRPTTSTTSHAPGTRPGTSSASGQAASSGASQRPQSSSSSTGGASAGRGYGRGGRQKEPNSAISKKPGGPAASDIGSMQSKTDPKSQTIVLSYGNKSQPTGGSSGTGGSAQQARPVESGASKNTPPAAAMSHPGDMAYKDPFSSRPKIARTPDKLDSRLPNTRRSDPSPLPKPQPKQANPVPGESGNEDHLDDSDTLGDTIEFQDVSTSHGNGYDHHYAGYDDDGEEEVQNISITINSNSSGRRSQLLSSQKEFYNASPPPAAKPAAAANVAAASATSTTKPHGGAVVPRAATDTRTVGSNPQQQRSTRPPATMGTDRQGSTGSGSAEAPRRSARNKGKSG